MATEVKVPDLGEGIEDVTISRWLVNEGDEVKAGQPLAVVEAMKMENVLRAERDGVVGAVRAKPGDSLAADQVILEFA